MRNNNNEYEVFESERALAAMGGVLEVPMIYLLVLMFKNGDFSLDIIIVSVIVLGLIIFGYIRSKTKIIVSKDGISIVNIVKNRFVPWEEMKYCYHHKTYRNSEYIIISQEELTKKKIQKLSLLSLSIYTKKAIVIPVKIPTKEYFLLKRSFYQNITVKKM